ncbi:MAG: hypothetical protein JSU86_14585 [Phycisphaerales bacterium]|nr:MAG: hypothetical protein JSU86_14585 [Phycisphaerales bacterium]
MEHDRDSVEETLLDWHLNRLDDEQRSWVEAELLRDSELRAKSDRLGQILQPLDHWRGAPAQLNLEDKVLAHVERSGQANRASPVLPMDGGGRGLFPFASLRDLLAVAACILLLIGVFVPGVSELRNRSQRAMCASNLGSISRGVSSYQQTFAGSLPFAGRPKGAYWLPAGARGKPYASNSRHAYLLVKFNYGPTPDDFICPGAKTGRPMRVDDLRAYDDFDSACNVSYAMLNLAGPAPNLRPVMPIVYLGDTNPLFVGARFNPSVDPDKTNSPAHRGRGQTVLTLDGSAKWVTKPVYGRQRDNLWLIGNIREYTGVEALTRDDDVQLVPGYPATDPLVCGKLRH